MSSPTIGGDSGGAATYAKDGKSYIVGLLSGVWGGQNSAVFSYLTSTQYAAAASLVSAGASDIAGVTDVIKGKDDKDVIRASMRRADIITNGSENSILVGSGGGLVNTGKGLNNIVFLPDAAGQADSGTTIVMSPGITTLVGGGGNDKLVMPVDRLDTSSYHPGAERADISISPSDTSATTQLLGGWDRNNSLSSGWSLEYDGFETGSESNYFVSYTMKDKDLVLIVDGGSWNSEVWIKNYNPGDFGLTFIQGNDEQAAMSSLTANAQQQSDVDDDASVSWTGINPAHQYQDLPDYRIASASDDDIKAALEKLTSDSNSPSPDVTIADDGTDAMMSGSATDTVTGNNVTITATGVGGTISFGGTGETASISSGTVNFQDSASGQVTGDSNALTLNGGNTVTVTGTANTATLYGTGSTLTMSGDQSVVEVGATGDTITLTGGQVNFWDDASGTVSGTGNSVTLNNGNAVALSGTSETATLQGTGDTLAIEAGVVNVWDGAGGTVTGDANDLSIYADASVIVNGSNNTATLYDTGSMLTMAGTDAIVDVASTDETVALTGGQVNFWDDTSGTVTGTGNGVTLNNNDDVTVAGTAGSGTLQGTGDALAISAGTIYVWDGAAGTVTGDANDLSIYAGTTITATGSGTTATLYDTGSTLTMSGTGAVVNVASTGEAVGVIGGQVNFWDGASATVTGAGNDVTLNNDDTVTVTGTGASATLQGTGDHLTVSGASIGVVDGSAATVTGQHNTLTLFGGAAITAAGTNDAFVFSPTPGTVSITGYDPTDTLQFSTSTFANWHALLNHASQQGADTVIHTDASHAITLAGVTLSKLQQSHVTFA